ncbi:MAG: PAS domain-containing protein, partial [Actinomycetales bacterium]
MNVPELLGLASRGGDLPARDAVLATALRHTSVPFALLDAALEVVWTNDAFVRMTGYDAAGARAHQRDLVPPGARRHQEVAAARDALRAGRAASATLTLRRADGTLFPCRVRVSPMPTGADEAPASD